jgi:uncharacterized protein YukE
MEVAMSAFSRYRGEIGEDVEEQLEHLRSEMAALRKTVAKQGARSYSAGQEQFSELYDELQEHLADLMPHIRRNARIAGRAVRENSTAVIVGTVLVGALAALFFARR